MQCFAALVVWFCALLYGKIDDVAMAIKSCSVSVPDCSADKIIEAVRSGTISPASFGAILVKTSDSELQLTAASADRLESFKTSIAVRGIIFELSDENNPPPPLLQILASWDNHTEL